MQLFNHTHALWMRSLDDPWHKRHAAIWLKSHFNPFPAPDSVSISADVSVRLLKNGLRLKNLSAESYQRQMSEKKSACTGVFHSILLHFYQLPVTGSGRWHPASKARQRFAQKARANQAWLLLSLCTRAPNTHKNTHNALARARVR